VSTESPGSPASGVAPVCYRHPDREAHIRCQRCGQPICPDCMRDASVGFQCPVCVSQGQKSSRQGRTAYGGRTSGNPQATTMTLIGINVVVWLAILVTGRGGSRLIDLLALRPDGICLIGNSGYNTGSAVCSAEGGTFLPGVVDGAYWQLVTNMFVHVEVWHLAANMLALYLFGPQMEHVLGRVRFLALFLVSGLAGSALVYWLAPEFQSTVGASGAVFGLLGGFLVITLKTRGDVRPILILLGLNALITFTIPRISWQGHLGGLIGGALVAALLVYAPRGPRRTVLQAAGVVGLVVLLGLAVAARSVVLA